MSSSARMYERLDQIPDDPEDPESLEDVVVCTFGAFERYYVCWKTRGGAFRQDGHDLPPDLYRFLFIEQDARDFASLQVVFGRGNEFFASDKNGKLEYKEPEPEKKEPSPEEFEEKRALRRSRTISFMRPRSDESQRQNYLDMESPSSSRRSSLIYGRPPSLSLSLRSNSDASLHSLHLQSQPDSRPPSISSVDQYWSRPSSNQTTVPSRHSSESELRLDDTKSESTEEEQTSVPVSVPPSSQSTRRLRPLSMSFKAGLIPRIPEGKQVPSAEYPSPPPPLPPMPGVSRVPTLPIPTPAKLWSAKSDPEPLSPPQPEVLPLQFKSRAVDLAPSARSVSPPFQLPEQDESPTNTGPVAHSTLSIETARTTAQTSPMTPPPGPSIRSPVLAIQMAGTVINTVPVVAVISPPPILTMQIISTAVETAPISPVSAPVAAAAVIPAPPVLSMQFSTLSTKPIEPKPPKTLPMGTRPPKLSTSTTSTQTSPPPSPLRTALPLRLDTNVSTFSFPNPSYSFSTVSSAVDIHTPQEYYEPPPVFMGRMMDYYSKPGYQLGASLFAGHELRVEGELTEWEKANGIGY